MAREKLTAEELVQLARFAGLLRLLPERRLEETYLITEGAKIAAEIDKTG